VRAYDPKPGAFTTLDGKGVKLYGARLVAGTAKSKPGEVAAIDGDGLVVTCGDGAVRILHVQPAGKKRMSPDAWLRGRGIKVGDRFEMSS